MVRIQSFFVLFHGNDFSSATLSQTYLIENPCTLKLIVCLVIRKYEKYNFYITLFWVNIQFERFCEERNYVKHDTSIDYQSRGIDSIKRFEINGGWIASQIHFHVPFILLAYVEDAGVHQHYIEMISSGFWILAIPS